MHLREDSPFTGFDFTVVADPLRARAFHLNRYGLRAARSGAGVHPSDRGVCGTALLP
ncbi:hypothetical protein [Streptomyces sp. NPDC088762]|uniref:hypothetical protein n=1 Tax=Streptomyces sp. NPDC088762 TaxID=3365891 RepID=UPI0037F774D2